MRSNRSNPTRDPTPRSSLGPKAIDVLIAEGRAKIVTAVTRGVEQLRGEYESKLLEMTSRGEAERVELAKRLEAAEKIAEHLAGRLAELKHGMEQKAEELPVTGPSPSAKVSPVLTDAGHRTRGNRPSLQSGRARSSSAQMGLAARLVAEGIEVIDKRDRVDGSLWVVGPRATVKPLIDGLRKQGIRFTYVAGGSRATANRPGWFTKHPD